jgi:hypothetical protein
MTRTRELSLSFSPDVAEEAVLLAVAGSDDEPGFRRARDPIYRLAPEERELAFAGLHQAWLLRLGLDRPVRQALDELPQLAVATARCLVSRAFSRADETVDLLVAEEEPRRNGRSILIRVRASALQDGSQLLDWLRRELLKVSDMLDPSFGYEPSLPVSGDPAGERLARERYRAIWEASATGRLVRRGVAGPEATDGAQRTFAAAFPMLHETIDESFRRFFAGEVHTHAEWAAFATAPCGVERHAPLVPGGRCPLCRFPTHAPEPAPHSLPADVIAGIVADFPSWSLSAGLCRQCADLYRAEVLSRQALADLPGTIRTG